MTDLDHAFANGRAWYADLQTRAKQIGSDDFTGEQRDEIMQEPLSVMVRDGWRQPGAASDGAEEYEILLSTGGPALRIYGRLDQYDEPADAELQAQDWGTPWTRVPDCDPEVLLTYARCFYFGN